MAKEEKKAIKKIAESNFYMTEHKQPFYTITAPIGTTRKDVLEPAFWTHVAKRLVPMAEIRIMPQDGSWYGVYLITYADTIQARVAELQYTDLDKVSPEDESLDDFSVEWGGPAHKFRVVRVVSGEKNVVKANFASKQDAATWMATNLKAA